MRYKFSGTESAARWQAAAHSVATVMLVKPSSGEHCFTPQLNSCGGYKSRSLVPFRINSLKLAHNLLKCAATTAASSHE